MLKTQCVCFLDRRVYNWERSLRPVQTVTASNVDLSVTWLVAAVLILAADAARIDREQDSQHRVMSRPVLICLIAALFYVTCAQCAFVKKPGELIFYCVCVCVCVCLCVCACVCVYMGPIRKPFVKIFDELGRLRVWWLLGAVYTVSAGHNAVISAGKCCVVTAWISEQFYRAATVPASRSIYECLHCPIIRLWTQNFSYKRTRFFCQKTFNSSVFLDFEYTRNVRWVYSLRVIWHNSS